MGTYLIKKVGKMRYLKSSTNVEKRVLTTNATLDSVGLF